MRETHEGKIDEGYTWRYKRKIDEGETHKGDT